MNSKIELAYFISYPYLSYFTFKLQKKNSPLLLPMGTKTNDWMRELLKYKFLLSSAKLKFKLQWNLSIADMLYSGHLSTADTLSRNQFSLAMVKPFYFEPLYSGHLSIADTFSENQWCPLLRGFTVTLRG